MNDMFYQPAGGAFTGNQPMKRVTKNEFLNSIENLYRYGMHTDNAIGIFYPVRVLPSQYIEKDSEWPIVMCGGSIVSIIPIKDARSYSAVDAVTGIQASGEVYVTEGVDGTIEKIGINSLYPASLSGFITPCNGGTALSMAYSNDDGEYGIITASGEVASAASGAYVNTANKPAGLINSQVWADMKFRYLNYERGKQGHAVQRGGVITVPYVLIYGAGSATVATAVRSAVNAKHQYVMLADDTENTVKGYLAHGQLLKSDQYAKFEPWVSGSHDIDQKFAEILEVRNRVPYGLDEIIDTFPNSGMTGTDTGGLDARLYNFITEIMKQTAVKPALWSASKENIKALLYRELETATSGVYITVGQVDVAFGTAMFRR